MARKWKKLVVDENLNKCQRFDLHRAKAMKLYFVRKKRTCKMLDYCDVNES
jgi:hypothetical protein